MTHRHVPIPGKASDVLNNIAHDSPAPVDRALPQWPNWPKFHRSLKTQVLLVDLASSREPKAPFSNQFVQLWDSYAGPHEEAKLPQGPNGTARITAGPVPSIGGEMSGIGKKSMLDTIHQINPIIKFINRYLGTSQNPRFQKLPKNHRKIGELWHFDTLPLGIHLKRLAKKLAAVVAWANWNFMQWSSPQLHCWASHRSGKNGHPCLAVHGPPGKSFRNEPQRCRKWYNKGIMAAWGLGCASFPKQGGLWTWLVEHLYFLLVDGWPRLLRGEASVERRSCKWRFLKSAAPKNSSDFPIRKGYFEKTRSRLESCSKWCDTYHPRNSTRQEWTSLTSDLSWALPQNPLPPLQPSRIRRASAISPVPWRWAVGVGSVQWVPWSKCWISRWQSLSKPLCESEIIVMNGSWDGIIYGFELLTHISCTSNY